MGSERITFYPVPNNFGVFDPVRSREGTSRTKQDAKQVRGFVRDTQRASASYGVEVKRRNEKEAKLMVLDNHISDLI